MHFVHKILCFEEFLHKIALFFKKIYFSRFSINWTYCLTNWNCDKKLVWICLFRSVLDRCWINQRHFRSIKSNFRSIENHIERFFFFLNFEFSCVDWWKFEFSKACIYLKRGFVQLRRMWQNWLVGLINLIIIYCDISCVTINW